MVSTSTLVISIALLLVGVWMMLWLIYSVLSPFLGFFGFSSKSPQGSIGSTTSSFSFGASRGFAERGKFRRSARALQEIDRLLVAEKISAAKKSFQRALFLEWIQHSPELLAKGAHHHIELLNKLIIVAELEGRSVRNLPKLETLLGKRTEILTSAFETRVARKRFSKKQKQKGKTPPKWSTKEFDVRLTDLKQELDKLRHEITKELKEALANSGSAPKPESSDNQYH